MQRFLIGILTCFIAAFATCCLAHEDLAGQKDNLVTEYGEWKCYTNLLVIANQGDSKISIKRLEPHGSVEQTAADWKTGKGWFVFAETPERIWIYNGNSLRLLLITPNIGSAIYGCDDYPVPIPSQ